MPPKRSRKGKEKVEFNDESEFKCPKPILDDRLAFSKNIADLLSPVRDVDNFNSFFKISKTTFHYIRWIVKDDMKLKAPIKTTFLNGQPMSVNDQIAISLKRLNSVDSNENIADLFETDQQTINQVTRRFVNTLIQHCVSYISWPSDTLRIQSGFKRIGGMPNCCGAIETTHLKMSLRSASSECDPKVWLDRANNISMNLQAIVDPSMRFLDVFVGVPGCASADMVLRLSEFFELAQNEELLNGTNEYVVGGSGFQLLPWLITPYDCEEEQMTEEQNDFNNVHLAARMVAKRALKKLKEVWSVIDGGMWRLNRHQLPYVVFACCILHNIQITMEGDGVSDVSTMLFDHDPGYPPEKSTASADENAKVVRDQLCLYLAGKETA